MGFAHQGREEPILGESGMASEAHWDQVCGPDLGRARWDP